MAKRWTPSQVKDLRHATGETQEVFARRFRITMSCLRCWEQGQRRPSGPATLLLDQLEAELSAVAAR